jgi:superfamily II DNA or RNA helicase/HKD family nuclease/diadenosine tetraphosphate (Ap4A) HIT family hydrolase
MLPSDDSPFLAIPPTDWLASNELAFAIADGFPVSEGHALIVPRRLVATWWEATREERISLLDLAEEVKGLLDEHLAPDGWNLGVNVGEAGGQTVSHLHLHLIPRYAGDVPDPRGGIRHAIPDRGNWQHAAAEGPPTYDAPAMRLFEGVRRPLGAELIRLLRNQAYDRLDVAVAFATPSGVGFLSSALADALEQGLHLRLLTSDYLDVTDPLALEQLLDLAAVPSGGQLDLRIVETTGSRGFHAKSYLFWSSTGAGSACLVGSSNLTRAALAENVEWNLQVDRIEAFRGSFADLWSSATVLDHSWVTGYRARRRAVPPSGERAAALVPEEPVEVPEPRPLQQQALAELRQARAEGHRSGLVVMATGLGKTWLAAFDTRDATRTLFIAHREEILQQSLEVFRRVQPERALGLATGSRVDLDAEVVFASVQWLHRNLDRIAPDWFERVVVDEFHHAAARSYRKVLDHFRPQFLLGLTATPERLDGADLLALTGDNLIFEVGLVEGIDRGELVPFRYVGVRDDTVDYTPVPWRAGRFDETVLTQALSTPARAEHVLETWREHGGGRTLAFCVTTAHADFMARSFAAAGVRAAAVHTAGTSAPRRGSIEQLADGELDVVFSVDLFNEGLDVPSVDTVLMLRPTQSPVVFLQQLGRGLRRHDGKEQLLALDFIGNHRAFLDRPRLLLGLFGEREPDPARAVELLRDRTYELPAGCEIEVPLESIELLEQLRGRRRKSALEEYVVARFEETGERPTAVQCLRAGLNPASARSSGRGWFDWLAGLDVLSDDELAAVDDAGPFLRAIEREQVTKSFKLLTLRAIARRGWLWAPAPLDELAEEMRDALLGDPRLLRDVAHATSPDPRSADHEVWRAYVRKNPVAAWAGEMRSDPSTAPFTVTDDGLVAKLKVDEAHRPAVEELVAEIVEWRLVRYIDSLVPSGTPSGVARLKVARNASDRPILFLRREQNPPLPRGDVEVLVEGELHTARFVKVACNVLTRPGATENVLPETLRRWFGDVAGASGTEHLVEFAAGSPHPTLRPTERRDHAGTDR